MKKQSRPSEIKTAYFYQFHYEIHLVHDSAASSESHTLIDVLSALMIEGAMEICHIFFDVYDTHGCKVI